MISANSEKSEMSLKEENTAYGDELTLKELILKIRVYYQYLWSKKTWIIISGLLGGILGVYLAWRTPITYTAELTYMVNEDETNRFGGAGAILSQFGLSGSGASEYNLDKIVALSKSRRIIEEVLFDSVSTELGKNILANHLIDFLALHEAWSESEEPGLSGFYFDNNLIDEFGRTPNIALRELYLRIVGREGSPGMLTSEFNDQTGILSLRTTTENQQIAALLTERIYQRLSDFYIQQSTNKQRKTYRRLSAKVDSVSSSLRKSEYLLAKFQDRSLGIGRRQDRLEGERLSREVQVLTIMYGEALKNRETAGFILDNSTPYFQLIDGVAEPLDPSRASKLVSAIKYSVLLVLLLTIYHITSYSLKLTMAE